MIKNRILFVVILSLVLISCRESESHFRPENLKCEYLVNPIGSDAANPRFAWKMNSSRKGASQKAYKVFVGTDSVDVKLCKGNMWESGKVNSSLVPVVYKGNKLQPFTRYYWGVKVMDERGHWSEISQLSFWETGMMTAENWKGDWISDSRDQNIRQAPYFRKTFEVKKNIKSARVYISVAGLYELYLNGRKVGDHFLDPMVTRFDRRALYVTFDVTQYIRQGKNALGVILGNGWYNLQTVQSAIVFHQAPWKARPKFCLDMYINFEDGSQDVISTGQNWKTSLSPFTFNSIYAGDHYDARLEQPGWNDPDFNDSQWKTSFGVGAPSQNIEAQVLQPIRIIEKIPVKDMKRLNDRTYIFDFGRNIAGVTQIKINGDAGTTIRLKHAELLDKKGLTDQSNIDYFHGKGEPFMTDIFILNGKGEESFMPLFSYKGFQYVEVTASKPVKLTKESLTAFFVHSDVSSRGYINSSNPTLNKIWEAANASYLSNLVGILTDCPTREKLGWTNDAHASIETGLYNHDIIAIFEKWLNDYKYDQQPNGVLPAFVPSPDVWGFHGIYNGVDLTSAIAIIPWNIYLFSGDSRLLENSYKSIKRYVDHIDYMNPSGLINWGLGDHHPYKSKVPGEFTASVYFYVDAIILAKAALLFGEKSDHEKYSALALKIKNAFNNKYLNINAGIYGQGFQTELSMPLVWGLVPDELREKVALNLSRQVIADDSHIDVGLFGSRAILYALTDNGYSDLAFKMAVQETFPSWGWWVNNGATTLHEMWNDRYSWNHHMFGAISAWFYKGPGGIAPDEYHPGFKNVLLKPHFVTGLDHFEARHEGPYGTIISSWKRTGGEILYNVTIPANSTASFYIQAKEILENGRNISENREISTKPVDNQLLCVLLKAGNYKFTIHE